MCIMFWVVEGLDNGDHSNGHQNGVPVQNCVSSAVQLHAPIVVQVLARCAVSVHGSLKMLPMRRP